MYNQLQVLQQYNVQMIGASKKAIEKAENRELFNKAMENIGLEVAKNRIVHNKKEAQVALEYIGLPAIIRPSFTLGGSGGGVAYTEKDYFEIGERGLDISPTNEIMIDESIIGWKEYEMEVVRDKNDNCIIVCSIENIDPMGVHTGDSITVAPALTLTDKEFQIMRDASIAILREIGVETGGSNVQFAVNPDNGKLIVIEMNPRVSRSSALASKATGFPIAKVAAKLAVGYTLDEIQNDVTKVTPSSFEPTIDYIVTKVPRFTFEKFTSSKPVLSSTMQSVGEVMAIGRSFAESLQKALCSMETGLNGLNSIALEGVDNENDNADNIEIVSNALKESSPNRLLIIAEAFRFGIGLDEVHNITKYDKWFLEQIQSIVHAEKELNKFSLPKTREEFLHYKKLGFSDSRMAEILNLKTTEVIKQRKDLKVNPVYKRVDTCACEFESFTPYMYSCYEGDGVNEPECEANPTKAKKVIILGSGPNRIGQGIEFDYACVHAAYALREAGYETIMINCNPETVSTDYDTSDRLYFEPITAEHVLEVVRKEQEKGKLLGVIVQLGGQTPLKLVKALKNENIPILGTDPDKIDLAEDRERFKDLLQRLDLKQPENDICRKVSEIEAVIAKIGYPVVIRPSYVLGGRAMRILHDKISLDDYINEFKDALLEEGGPILIDKFLTDAIEVDVDALGDDEDVFVAGVMEHIEEAGIHSGDSACSIPPHSLTDNIIGQIKEHTVKLAKALKIIGLMNVQYAVKDSEIYVIEVNPRASRTVPFVAKATGNQIVKIASMLMVGKKLSEFDLKYKILDHVAVKEAVFPFARFTNADVILGPEMKSTGEVMGIDESFDLAFAKAQIASGNNVPLSGTVFISVKDEDKMQAVEIASTLSEVGFEIVATKGTAKFLQDNGVDKVKPVNKVRDGSPHIVDKIKADEIALVINTTESERKTIQDSFSIRRSALLCKVPYSTTIAGAKALTKAISKLSKNAEFKVRYLQEIGEQVK